MDVMKFTIIAAILLVLAAIFGVWKALGIALIVLVAKCVSDELS